MTLLANDLIMSERLILLFRNLEYQNPSIISDFIASLEKIRRRKRSRRRRRRRRKR